MEHFYQNIDGFMSERNTILLDAIIKLMPENCNWVELGSWTGKSAAYCAVELINSNKFGKFTTIDSWGGGVELQSHSLIENASLKDVFMNNMSPILDRINVIQDLSWNAASQFDNNSLDFCYVDAGHTYEDVTKDLIAWWPKIKNKRWIGGDDYTKGHIDLIQAVDDFFEPLGHKVRKKGRCWVVQKIIPA